MLNYTPELTAYEKLDTIILNFGDFRSIFNAARNNYAQKPVIQTERLEGVQIGKMTGLHETTTDFPKLAQCMAFVDRNEGRPSRPEVSRGNHRELEHYTGDDYEKELDRAHKEIVESFSCTMLVNRIELDDHTVDIERLDRDEPISIHPFFNEHGV